MADVVSFRIGYFVPAAKSDLWQTEFNQMSFTKSDFSTSGFVFSYEYFLSREISISISVDSYTKQKMGEYMDYVGETIDYEDWAFDYGEGWAILHNYSVSITPIQASLKLTPLGRRAKFIPYIGGGVGIYLWGVKMFGDLVDFNEYEIFYDPNIDDYVAGYSVYTVDAREEGKIAFGYHAFAGFMIPIANRISLDASFKYSVAKGNLTEAFEGFEPFDLSGYQISVGINYWF